MSKNFLTKIEIKNTDVNSIRTKYISLIQYAIKKGNKTKIENFFKQLLKLIATNVVTFNFKEILTAFENVTPTVGIKTKRKGSKNIYLPISLTKTRKKYLASNWLIQNAKTKQNKNFYKNLLEELQESSIKKSNSFKKCYDLHKLAENSLINIKLKLK